MSASGLIKGVEVAGLGGGGVVAAALGDVRVAGVFDGRDDGGADGGQVGGPGAGAAGRGVFAESHVPDVVVRLNGPVLAGQAGQVLSGGAGAGQAGDGVDGLAGGLAGSGVLPPAGGLDGDPESTTLDSTHAHTSDAGLCFCKKKDLDNGDACL